MRAKGTQITTTVDDNLLKFLDRYCELRAIPRGQGMRECIEIAQRMSAAYAVTVSITASRKAQVR